MADENYLDFDGAVLFLKTTPSTLYKWLQAGRVKGHKLGRQWRFVKTELEAYLNGSAQEQLKSSNELSDFVNNVLSNKITEKSHFEKLTEIDVTKSEKVFESLILDIQSEYTWASIHFKPQGNAYGVYSRQGRGLKFVTEISYSLFSEFEKYILEVGAKTKKENQFRFRIYKNENDFLQVKSQILETVLGNSIVLDLFNPEKYIGGQMEKIIPNKDHLKEVLSWTEKTHGIIFVTGKVGSGKSTTIHGIENVFVDKNLACYNLANEGDQYVQGVSYIEYKLHDKDDFKKEFSKILNSDPDVISLTGSFINIEDEMMRNVYEAAKSGHIVILQMDFEKISEVQKFVNEKSKELNLNNFDELTIGILSQKLIQKEKGKVAETEIL